MCTILDLPYFLYFLSCIFLLSKSHSLFLDAPPTYNIENNFLIFPYLWNQFHYNAIFNEQNLILDFFKKLKQNDENLENYEKIIYKLGEIDKHGNIPL